MSGEKSDLGGESVSKSFCEEAKSAYENSLPLDLSWLTFLGYEIFRIDFTSLFASLFSSGTSSNAWLWWLFHKASLTVIDSLGIVPLSDTFSWPVAVSFTAGYYTSSVSCNRWDRILVAKAWYPLRCWKQEPASFDEEAVNVAFELDAEIGRTYQQLMGKVCEDIVDEYSSICGEERLVVGLTPAVAVASITPSSALQRRSLGRYRRTKLLLATSRLEGQAASSWLAQLPLIPRALPTDSSELYWENSISPLSRPLSRLLASTW